MKRKLTFVIAVALSAMLLVTGCGSSSQGNTPAPAGNEGGTFKVGLEAGYAPFNWTQMDASNGGVKIDAGAEYAGGYDVEIAKKLAEGLGKELVVVKTEWDGLVPALTSGKIDAIIAGMSPTEKRKATIDFSDIYYQSDLVLVVKSGSKYESATSLKDFNGAKITAQLNTFHYDVVDQIEGVVKQTAMDNFPAMRVAVQSGMIDGYVSERPEGVSAQAANSDFKMVELTEGFQTSAEDTAIAVGVKKGSELTAKINEILKGIPEAERLQIMDDAIKNQPAAN